MSVEEVWRAAQRGDVQALTMALAAGQTPPNALQTLEDGYQQPVFFGAALNGHLEAVEALRDAGANLMACDSDGDNIFGLLGRYGRDELAEAIHKMAQQPTAAEAEDLAALQWKKRLAQAVMHENQQQQQQQLEQPPQSSLLNSTRERRLVVESLLRLSQEQAALSEQRALLARRQDLIEREMATLLAQLSLLERLEPNRSK